ncbi:hypothetical protein TVD_06045 [Thioalkalivibrio versutus]|uniref:Uncharacterized protein n=1 Tax=Thioalkalivibrio versutus TaxID=106634 RepID=A0A0G3G7U7_9GAMM|nr:hypothetical protein [Thioalkalivibrio versutus]AKJ94946.1 hypothetical protein TVD_06045 [Thioalkalivibrio versutus]
MSPALKSALYATAFFLLSVLSFGVNDWFSLLMLLASIMFLYPTILVGQMTLRNVAKTAVQEDSALYAFLNKPKTVPQQLFSFVVAVVLGVSFLTVSKGIVINHGLLPVVFIVFFLAWWISGRLVAHPNLAVLEGRHLNRKALVATVSDEESSDRDGPSADVSFLSLFAAILVLNLLLAMLLSAKDLFTFFTTDVTISNFRSYAAGYGVEAGAFNSVSRVFINVYVLFESFKLAAANEIVSALGFDKSGSHSAYYLFYMLVLVFNVLKLLAFSVPLVFLQRGLLVWGFYIFEVPGKRVGRVVEPYMRWLISPIGRLISPFLQRVKRWFLGIDEEGSLADEGTPGGAGSRAGKRRSETKSGGE